MFLFPGHLGQSLAPIRTNIKDDRINSQVLSASTAWKKPIQIRLSFYYDINSIKILYIFIDYLELKTEKIVKILTAPYGIEKWQR